ncbi:aldose 1-epimerase family protein [bacterium]|jgi:hypothetical protein|nr:aldose 1-epimerase family protein [Planctomicrobium sp.]MDA7527830.1 aldose 1-epimerase family protein [bacterium]
MLHTRFTFLFAASLSLLPLLNDSSIAEDHRFVLTNTESNRFVGKKTLSARDFDGVSTDEKWSITKEVLKGGKQDGVDLITVDNGRMKIRIIPTRGMNILDLQVDDFRLGWNSPVKEVVHPSYINLDTRGGLGWLDGFNEWMVRCGLEFAGHPGVDKFIDNTGAEAEMNLSLHGKVGNIPASHVEVRIQKEKPHRITIRGTVHERMFFGPKLQLVTEISTLPGSEEVTITDSVTNNGANDQEMMLIYHTNYGEPLLEAGAKVVAPIKSLAPMNETAVAGLKDYATYGAPQADFLEQVFLTELFADQDDQTLVCLHSKNGERAASISYSVKELPYFTIWKNTTARENGYVTGLEPGTSFPFNRHVERKFGRVPKLAPGETREFSLTYGVHLGKKSVQSVLDEIEEIQDSRKTTVSDEVPEH